MFARFALPYPLLNVLWLALRERRRAEIIRDLATRNGLLQRRYEEHARNCYARRRWQNIYDQLNLPTSEHRLGFRDLRTVEERHAYTRMMGRRVRPAV